MKTEKFQRKLAIISMSGGLDSATLCAEALNQGYEVFVVNFNYNQKNIVELKAFDNLVEYFTKNYGSNGKIIGVKKLNLKPLFDEFLNVWASLRDDDKIEEQSHHKFYTPSRNLLFSVISTVIGEIIAIDKDYSEISIGIGIHKHSEEAYGEHKDYWDITPEFAKRLQSIFDLNDVVKVNIFAPFVDKTKTEVVKRGMQLVVPFEKTWTCYDPQKLDKVFVPCGVCEACIERRNAGKAAGVMNINKYSVSL